MHGDGMPRGGLGRCRTGARGCGTPRGHGAWLPQDPPLQLSALLWRHKWPQERLAAGPQGVRVVPPVPPCPAPCSPPDTCLGTCCPLASSARELLSLARLWEAP